VPVAASTVTIHRPLIVQRGGSVGPFLGFGAQFFTQLFGEAGNPATVSAPLLAELQNRVQKLKPGHSRIAVRLAATQPGPAGQVERRALMNAIALAEEGGANVNLTWWHGPYYRDPKNPTEAGFLGKQFMEAFADVIEEARRRFDCVTHVTIQNEVNNQDIGRKKKTPVSMRIYNRLYRFLDTALKARADPRHPAKKLRDAVDFVGGDLLTGGHLAGSNQRNWLKFMQENMADILDGYSVHVYWSNGDYRKLEGRLTRLLELREELDIKLPLYVTEYGVRGANFGKNGRFNSGRLAGKNIEESSESAFQHAWFNALAPQCGIVGLAKWACYRVDGRKRPERDWGMICGARKRFLDTPTYRMTVLFNRLIDDNWKADGLGRGDDTLVSVFKGPAGGQSAVVLNRGRELEAVTIDHLKKNTSYFAAGWNRGGDGMIHSRKRVTTGPNGIVKVNVPGSSLVALSTRPLALTSSG
jgi:hypothetical protein